MGSKKKTERRKKVLRARQKKASKGRVIRVSDEVFLFLNQKRGNRVSWDSLLRKLLGLPDRDGGKQDLLEGWMEVHSGTLFPTAEQARGEAVMQEAKWGNQYMKPVKMREVRW